MGEHATYNGQQIKMGTCEDMYYLRATQARLIRPEHGSLNPADPKVQAVIRFRFPWPDEDGIEPGAFDAYDRAVTIHGAPMPTGIDHHNVQFSARAGYLVSLPCPEGLPGATEGMQTPGPHGLTIGRNGFAGRVQLVQHAYRNGHLAVILQCGGCHARWNVPTWAEAEGIVVACRAEADQAERRGGDPAWWHAVADRIAAGYGQPAPAEVTA